MKFHTHSFLAFFLLLGSCNLSSERSEFDRKPILENISENLIIPFYQSSLSEVMALDSIVNYLQQDPTEETLLAARDQWKELVESWKKAEIFNFGPIEDIFVQNKIDYWPVDTAGVESAINAFNQQRDYLEIVGSNKKGLAAIEYVLFYQSDEQSLLNPKNKNRSAYLNLLCEDLISHFSNLLQEWTNGYQQQFIESTGNSASSSLTLVANEMIFLLEKIKKEKLAIPMGKTEMSDANPKLVESPYSNYSLVLIKENLEAAQTVFNGADGKGMDDYLDALDIKNDADKLLSTQINEQFTATILAVESIDTSLSEAIATKNPLLDQLYLNVLDLSILLKNDMMSQLGLLVIFSDNDGD